MKEERSERDPKRKKKNVCTIKHSTQNTHNKKGDAAVCSWRWCAPLHTGAPIRGSGAGVYARGEREGGVAVLQV
jgi:hypothetical protein